MTPYIPKQMTFEELSAACGKHGREKEELLRSLRQTECTGWLLDEKFTLIPYGPHHPADKPHSAVIVGYMPASHLAWIAELREKMMHGSDCGCPNCMSYGGPRAWDYSPLPKPIIRRRYDGGFIVLTTTSGAGPVYDTIETALAAWPNAELEAI